LRVGAALLTAAWLSIFVLACGPTASRSPSIQPSTIPSSPIEGVVVSIDSAGLTDVTGFSLRTPDGRTYMFKMGQLENGTEFPPGHLAEHRANAEPIRVTFRVEGGTLVAVRLEDASG
jgi:hypothetical protein